MASNDSEAAISETLLSNSNCSDRALSPEKTSAVSDWSWCGARVSKNQVTYMTQVFLVYGVIAVSLSQLILQSFERELWLILLTTSIGYVLPSPRLKFLKPKISTISSVASATATTAATSSSSLSSLPLPSVNFADTRDTLGGGSSSDSDVEKEVIA